MNANKPLPTGSHGATKRVLLIVAVVLGLGAAWFGFASVRAHRNLVTLNVRNEDVKKVVRMLERQTRETIVVQRDIEGKITLNVRRQPLDAVLEIIAEQASCRWTAYYPLYTSSRSLDKFKQAVLGDIPPEENGWTNLQSRGFGFRGGMMGDLLRSQSGLINVQLENKDLEFALLALARFSQAQVVPEDGTAGTVNLQLKQALFSEAVAQIAKQVKRNWTVFYALRSWRGGRGGGDFTRRDGPPDGDRRRDRDRDRGPQFADGGPPTGDGPPPFFREFRRDGTNSFGTNQGGPPPEFVARMERQYEAALATMTPEERQRAEQERQFFESLRALPEDQRRASMAERMSSPEVQQRMQARTIGNIKNTTPEQRAERARERAMSRGRDGRGR
jgi:hypothetical protein